MAYQFQPIHPEGAPNAKSGVWTSEQEIRQQSVSSPTGLWSPMSNDTLIGAQSPELKSGYEPPQQHSHHHHHFRKSVMWKFRHLTSRFWLWEAGACILALGLLGVIFGILIFINNKPTWHWEFRWSPTAVLAFVVTVMKAAILIPVSSAIGQLKWHRFKRYDRLRDMELYDEASRGSIGSARLLLSLKFW
jgi:hypothetical protein